MIPVTKPQLLTQILEELRPLEYAILHGYTNFPDQITSDVDIIGSAEVLKKLKQIAISQQYPAVQVLHHEATCYYFVFWSRGSAAPPVLLPIDYAADYRRDGRVFYRADELLPHRRLFRDTFSTLPPALEFGYYIVKKIGKGNIGSEQSKRLSALYKQDPQGCDRELTRFFPSAEAKAIASAAKSEDWSSIRARIKLLRSAMLRKLAFSRLRDTVGYIFSEWLRKIGRVTQPTGLVVAILGMDGSGKSTVLKKVEQDLLPAFRRTKYAHLRPSLKRRKSAAPVSKPHAKPPRVAILSALKLFFWLFEYLVGWLADVYPRKISSTLVLFDRYYYDIYVDPARYRYGGPLWLSRLVGRFVPKPDILILLDLPAEKAIARKPEVELSAAKILRGRYLEVAKNIGAHIVSADKSPEEVAAQIEKIVLDHMAERTARRLGSRR